MTNTANTEKTGACFNCPRTCRKLANDDCQFNALLHPMGVSVRVNSETSTVSVSFASKSALASAIELLGGEVIGVGSHELFAESVNGFGFRLPNWRLPLVVNAAGQLKYDSHLGRWGNESDVETLKTEYALSAAAAEASKLGWLSERVDIDGAKAVRVFHPNGGYLDVTSDSAGVDVNAIGFNGVGCHEAVAALSGSIGDVRETTMKPEAYNELQTEQGA